MCLLAGISIVAISVPAQIVRSFIAGADLLDYLCGARLAFGLLISLLRPRFKSAIVMPE